MNAIQQIRRNTAKVMSGQVLVTGLNFTALFLNARALGVDALGVLVVLQASGDVVRVLISFQTWQVVVQFGAYSWTRGDYRGVRQVYRYALMLDLWAAIVSAVLLAGIFLLGGWLLGLSSEAGRWGALYAVSLLALGSGASVGILKLTDRLGLMSMVSVGISACMALNAAVLAAIDATFSAYVWSITILTSLGGILVICVGWWRAEALARGQVDLTSEQAHPLDRRSALRFAMAASLTSTLEAIGRRGEVLLISGLLGPTAAGLFGVADRCARLVATIAEVGRVAVYPEIAKAAAGDSAAAKLIVVKVSRMSLGVAGAAFLVILFVGDSILSLGFGEAYRPAHVNLIWLCGAASLYAAGFALGPYVQVVFGAGRLLRLTMISFIVYCAAAVAGPLLLGPAGAGLGSLAFQLTLVGLLAITAFVLPARLRSRAAAPGEILMPGQSSGKELSL